MLSLRCEERMSRRLFSVKPLDSVQHARELMEAHRVNQLPVVVGGRLVGIITDRDVRDASPSVFEAEPEQRIKHVAAGADPEHIHVKEVMTENVVTLGPQARLVDAARLMRQERIGAVPILDGEHLVGIVTRSDILDAFANLADAP